MQQAWAWLSSQAAASYLRPVIGNVFPITKAGDAYRLLLERKNFGKVVLTQK
jgi:NADPH:quinone reductase-like Zn-dependent oxidoreductase